MTNTPTIQQVVQSLMKAHEVSFIINFLNHWDFTFSDTIFSTLISIIFTDSDSVFFFFLSNKIVVWVNYIKTSEYFLLSNYMTNGMAVFLSIVVVISFCSKTLKSNYVLI